MVEWQQNYEDIGIILNTNSGSAGSQGCQCIQIGLRVYTET